MENTILKTPLNPIQLDLLRLSTKLDEKDILQIRKMISRYLAEKLMDSVDELWEEKGWANEYMEELSNTHMRTPYNPKNI